MRYLSQSKKYHNGWGDALLIVGAILAFISVPIFVYFFAEIHQWLLIQQHLETIRFITYFLGGVLLYLQFLMANRRARAMEKSVHMQAESNELTRKGQLDQRFKDAIEQLGHDHLAVRLGAIYSLHHLACDNEIYRSTVHKIFCAYLRNWTASPIIAQKDNATATLNQSESHSTPHEISHSLGEDRQAILNLIVGNAVDRQIYEGLKINLRTANLAYADLAKSNLRRAQMSGASLFCANLYKADLSQAILYNANLKQLQGIKINLTDAYIVGADFENAKLRGAEMGCIDKNSANLLTAELTDAKFTKDEKSE